MRPDRLTYRCPACGNQTLMIDDSGWLVCLWIPCRNPSALHDIIEAALSQAGHQPPHISEAMGLSDNIIVLPTDSTGRPLTSNTVQVCRCDKFRHPHDPAEHHPDPDYGFVPERADREGDQPLPTVNEQSVHSGSRHRRHRAPEGNWTQAKRHRSAAVQRPRQPARRVRGGDRPRGLPSPVAVRAGESTMIVKCSECRRTFDDTYRSTLCPHETFPANDGANNFVHHPESHLSRAPERESSLGEEFSKEQARVRVVLGHYKEIGPAGRFGAAMIEDTLRRADAAAISGDVVEMLRAFEEMKGIKE